MKRKILAMFVCFVMLMQLFPSISTAVSGLSKEHPAAAYDPKHDKYLVAYLYQEDSDSKQTIRYSIVGSDGSWGEALKATEEETFTRRGKPKVAFAETSEKYLVVWSDGGMIGQVVNSDGSLPGADLNNITISDKGGNPEIAYDSENDRFLVVWNENVSSWDSGDIYGQMVNPDGTLFGDKITIIKSYRSQTYPTIAYDSINKKFLVAWLDDRAQQNYYDIFGKFINTDGTQYAGDFKISDRVGYFNQEDLDLAFNSGNGQFLLTWHARNTQYGNYKIFGRMLYLDKNYTNDDRFIISEATRNLHEPSVVFDHTLNRFFVVMYHDDYSNTDIYGQFVNSEGGLDGTTFSIVQSPFNELFPKVVTTSTSGKYLLTYAHGTSVRSYMTKRIATLFVEGPDTQSPVWPIGSQLTAADITGTGLTLNWDQAEDNVTVHLYKVYKGTSPIATLFGDMTSYNVTGLTEGVEYNFHVEACDAAGNWTADGPSITVIPRDVAELEEGAYSFGDGQFGKLGHGGFDDRLTPTEIEGLNNVKAISAGYDHSLVLLENRDVYSFGGGYSGQLGHGDTNDRPIPTKIEALSGVKAISAGGDHSLVLLENGEAYSFGGGYSGQLGHGDGIDRLTPTKIEGLSSVKAISAGSAHSLLLLGNGEVYSFGNGYSGQLGHGDKNDRLMPTKIEGLTNVQAISAGDSHSLVLLENGEVYSFGSGEYGKLGHGDTANKLMPTKIEGLSGVQAISAGDSHSLVLLENGEVYSFGNGYTGQLGHGDSVSKLMPTKIEGLSSVKAISAGVVYSLVLLENGEVYSFGNGYTGQLGHGDTANKLTPTKIEGLSSVQAISAGDSHSLVLINTEPVPPVTYTVTFDKNDGDTEASPMTETAVSGGNVGSLPIEPTYEGFIFSGWNTQADGNGTAFTAATPVTGDITVYAQWTAVPPTLVTSITVKGTGDATTVVNGGTLQMVAEIEPSDAADKTVVWSVVPGTGSATIHTSAGVLTGTGEGTVTVRATANDGSGIYGETTITVEGVSVPESPAISPASVNFDLAAPADVFTFISWGSATSVTDVVYGSGSLIQDMHFAIEATKLTLYEEYLSSLNLVEGEKEEFDIFFNDENTTVQTLTVNAVRGYIPGNDAALIDLRVGDMSVTDFVYNRYSYTVQLPYDTKPGDAAAIVSAAARDHNASVTITQVTVLPGSATVEVTAEDGTTRMTYTIDFTLAAPSSNADLSSLTLSTGTLNPGFSGDTTSYTASVSHGVSSITVTPFTANENAAVKVNNQSTASGQASQAISLSVGSNTITVVVTAQDGTTKTYMITVNRASSGGGSTSSTPAPIANATLVAGTYKANIPVSTDRAKGITTVSLNGSVLNEAFSRVESVSGMKVVNIEMSKEQGTESYVLQVPSTVLASENDDRKIEMKSEVGTLTLPVNMLQGLKLENIGNVGISIGKADKSGLPKDVKDRIGDRPVVELKLMAGNKTMEWSNPDAPVTVAIPYTPTAEELKDPEHIVAWYIDGSGNVISVPSGRYDPATGMLTFTTTHFSNYAAAYVYKTFNDLGTVAWAKKPIQVLASKGILNSTSEKEYAPQTNITRADFLYFLVRTLGVEAKIDGNFDDIDRDAYYYQEIAIAKKLGITSGTGNNKFNPNASITRQDMMVLTEKALRMLKKLKEEGMASDVEMFTDKSLIASYAIHSVASIVKEELIVGSGDKVNPLGNTTRAEAAVFLYKIYNKY